MPKLEQYRRNPEKYIEASKNYRLSNPEKVRKTKGEHYRKNKEKIIEKSKQWGIDNPEKRRVIVSKWKKNNPEKANKIKRIWTGKMYKTNITFNLKAKISGLMRQSLEGNKNGCSFITFMDYTVKELREHLKGSMPNNYTWKDFLKGKLHIDHIIPIRAFEFKAPEDEEFKQCWSLSNLRLLSAKENIKKGDKIDNPILLGLLIKEMI